ncbi:MAG: hypothetical protein ACREHD_30305, partial [Pirellulales bacterium]
SSLPGVSGLLLDVYTPVPFTPGQNAAQIAQDVVNTLGAGAVGDGSPGNPLDRVTLSGNLQFVALPSSEDTAYTFSTTDGNPVTVGDHDIVGANASNSALQFEEIVSVRAGEGVLHVTNTAGITFLGSSSNNQTTLDFQGTLDAINQALDGLQFDPVDEYVGPVQIAFFTNDHGNIGVAPAPSFSPAGEALFSQEEDVYLAILGVSDHPTIDNSKHLSLSSINETPSVQPSPAIPAPDSGNTVYSILHSDPLGGSAMTVISGNHYGIAITGASIANQKAGPAGVWQYSLNGGSTWINMPAVSMTNALLLDGGIVGGSQQGDLVRFLPDPNFNNFYGTPTLTFYGWD